MSILNKDQLLAKIKARIGDDTTDEAIQLIEDVNDTYSDYETKTKDKTEWEKKYKDNDEQWRKKYRDRFFDGTDKPDEPEKPLTPDVDKPEKLTFENLFKEETK